jgi:molybdenum cofactor cytidylyltransferase
LRRAGAEDRDASQLIAGVLLAAGQSTRYGRQKLLEPWHGEPLVRKTARCFLDAGLRPLVVVVSPDRLLADALAGLTVTIVENPRPEDGISRSIAIGVRALPAATDATLIGVGDQPYLTVEAIEALVKVFSPGRIVVPRWGDHRGNPPIFDRRYFAELAALDGDVGGQRVIAAHEDAVTEVPLPATLGDDIDRPEQWPRS